MTKVKLNQKGFAIIESLLILVIIAVIGGVGWYAIHTKHQTDQILAQSEKNSQSSVKQDGWQTLDHDATKNVDGLAEVKGIHFSLKYPAGWKYLPIGTEVSPSGATAAPAGYNQLVPADNTKNDFNLEFQSGETNYDAQAYWHIWKVTGIPAIDNSSKILKTFTTENGYSALTGETNNGTDSNPVKGDITLISDRRGIVIFSYNPPTSSEETAYNLIFNSLKFL